MTDAFDVFISYAHADADWVRVLAENLHQQGLQVFFDEWEIGPGDVLVHRLDMPDEAQEPITRPLAFAVAPGMTAAEILKELRHYIDPVFLPRPLILALPRNAVGKLPRETLVKLAAQAER